MIREVITDGDSQEINQLDAAIDEFVKTNYNVDFPMFSKIDVRGESISPVWQYLTGKLIRKSW